MPLISFRRQPDAGTVVASIVAVAAPAAIALLAFYITGDPRLRPLSLTEDQMVEVEPPVADGLVRVEVHWASTETTTAPALALARSIKATFEAKGQDAWVLVLRDFSGAESHVLYRVGTNVFGPYPLGSAAKGVRPALKAVGKATSN